MSAPPLFPASNEEQQTTPMTLCSRLNCSAVLTPILLGVILSSIALGGLVILAGRCWLAFPGPRWKARRALVVIVLVLQCLQTALDIDRVISIFALHFGDLSFFLRPRFTDAGAPFVGALIQMQCQLFLVHRAFRFASVTAIPHALKWSVTAFVILCIFGGAAMGCGVALEIKLLGSFIRLVPGSESSILYNQMVLAWLWLGAAVDSFLFGVIAHELFTVKRATHGSIKNKQMRLVLKRMVSILAEAGIVLVIAQVGTAIFWQVEAAKTRHDESSWVYLAILVLPKFYSLTYFAMLLAASTDTPTPRSSRPPPPRPISQGHLYHDVVETIEYAWGKESTSNSSSNEGVITVTGLPLDASPHYNMPTTYIAPFADPVQGHQAHRHVLSSITERSTPPSSPTPFLGISAHPPDSPIFPPTPHYTRTPPRSHTRSHRPKSSSARSPPSSPLRSSFRPHAEVPEDIAEEGEESVGGSSAPTGASVLLEIMGEEEYDDQATLASYRFGSDQRGSSFIDLGHSTIVPSPSSTIFSQSIYSASRKGSNATAGSSSSGTGSDDPSGRKTSDASSWACVDAKGVQRFQPGGERGRH